MSSDSEKQDVTPVGSKNDPSLHRNTYKIVVQDGDNSLEKLSAWTMESNLSPNSDQRYASNLQLPTDNNGNIVFTGVTIEEERVTDIILKILAHTVEGYKFLNQKSTPDQSQFDGNTFTNFFTFETTAKHNTYNKLTNSYSTEYTITIIPKIVTRLGDLTSSPGLEITIKKMFEENLLIKGYNYIFTGLNTDIVDLSMNFSTFWTDSMPFFAGLLNPSDVSNRPMVTNQKVETYGPPVAAVDKSVSINSGSFANNAIRVDQTPVQKYLENYSPQSLTLESFASQRVDRDMSQTNKLNKGLTSVGSQTANTKLSIFGFISDRAFVSINNSMGSASMLEINMTIKGDPYWLGITKDEVVTNYNDAFYSKLRKQQREFAVFQSCEQNFYLKFSPPQGIDNSSGLMTINNSSVFNTLYSVIKIVSVFENGAFRQELQAYVNRSVQAASASKVCDPILNNPFYSKE